MPAGNPARAPGQNRHLPGSAGFEITGRVLMAAGFVILILCIDASTHPSPSASCRGSPCWAASTIPQGGAQGEGGACAPTWRGGWEGARIVHGSRVKDVIPTSPRLQNLIPQPIPQQPKENILASSACTRLTVPLPSFSQSAGQEVRQGTSSPVTAADLAGWALGVLVGSLVVAWARGISATLTHTPSNPHYPRRARSSRPDLPRSHPLQAQPFSPRWIPTYYTSLSSLPRRLPVTSSPYIPTFRSPRTLPPMLHAPLSPRRTLHLPCTCSPCGAQSLAIQVDIFDIFPSALPNLLGGRPTSIVHRDPIEDWS